MPRPLLEIWREQNRDREPSSLLTVPSHDALRRMQQSANTEIRGDRARPRDGCRPPSHRLR
jgi:hypothetical protein